MKHLVSLCGFLFLFLILESCSRDFLDKPPLGIQDEDAFFNSPGAGFEAVTNSYLGLIQDFWGSMAGMAELGNMATDDAEKGGSDAGDRPFVADLGYGRALSNNETLSGFWSARYQAIGNCNVNLENMAKQDLIDGDGDPLDENVKKRYLAEIRFLRAKFYFDLVRIFGGVPLITSDPSLEDRDKLRRTSADSIFNFIEIELRDAAEDLPSKAALADSELGRATKEAAWALLARGYLFFADDHNEYYSKAKEVAKKVIDSHSFSLVPNYQDLWLPDGFKTDEPVFMVMIRYKPSDQILGSAMNVYTMPRSVGGWGFDSPTQNLVDEFEEGDPRLLYTVIDDGDKFPRVGGGEETLDFSTNPNGGYYGKKTFLVDSRRGDGLGNNTWNYYIIRYSDVLLMYAEGLLKSGGDKGEVANYINEVRNRASNSGRTDIEAVDRVRTITNRPLPEVTISDDLAQAIEHERRVEFGMEYLRLFDLIRWQKYVKTMHDFSEESYSHGRGSNFKEPEGKRFVFPIPQVEIDRSNGSIQQNPGY